MPRILAGMIDLPFIVPLGSIAATYALVIGLLVLVFFLWRDVKRLRQRMLITSNNAFNMLGKWMKTETDLICLRREHDSLLADCAVLKECRDFWQKKYWQAAEAAKGNYWIWQGDGSDHLESLTCPVLIQPQDLKHIIGAGYGVFGQGRVDADEYFGKPLALIGTTPVHIPQSLTS